jgi:hypothetical protein
MPDGIFSNQKSQFGLILEGLKMDDAGIFYGCLVYVTAVWWILWILSSFGIFFPVLVCCANRNLSTQRPNPNFAPRGEFFPLGVKFSVRPSILLNSRECLLLGVNKGVNISCRGQISPLGANFTPTGEVLPFP